MDPPLQLKLEKPVTQANILSRIFYIYLIPFFYKCTIQGIELIDLFKPSKNERSSELGERLEHYWNEELLLVKEGTQPRPYLLRALRKVFLISYMWPGAIVFINAAIIWPLKPVFLAHFIQLFAAKPTLIFFTHNDQIHMEMFITAVLMALISYLSSLMIHHSIEKSNLEAMRVETAVCSIIYRKLLRLNHVAMEKITSGKILNVVTNDIMRFEVTMRTLHYIWVLPFSFAVCLYVMWQIIGVSAFVGILSITIFSLIIQGNVAKWNGRFRTKVATCTDQRVKTITEIMAGIQVIKLYAWQQYFRRIVETLRSNELNHMRKANYLRAAWTTSMVVIERTAIVLTVICYILLGNKISADQLFSMAQFYNILQLLMSGFFALAILWGSECLCCVKRIEEVLALDEQQQLTVQEESSEEVIYDSETSIRLNQVSAEWHQNKTVLHNINLDVKPGQLCAVIGMVGAGKSSLLHVLVGELIPLKPGRMKIGKNDVVSYCSQEAWLFSGTVRANILFGKRFDRARYTAVVSVCALEKDFQQLPYSDKTQVGDKGVVLSGGQRARINLARAIYREASIYLLDDPLSAVDTHVSKHLFEECITGYLKGTTIVLVTHHLQYLKYTDHIVVLNKGEIEAQGSFEELTLANFDFFRYIDDNEERQSKDICSTIDNSDVILPKLIPNTGILQRKHSGRYSLQTSSRLSVSSMVESQFEYQDDEEETTELNKMSAFKVYMRNCGNIYTVVIYLLYSLLSQTSCGLLDWFLAFWVQTDNIHDLQNNSTAKNSTTAIDGSQNLPTNVAIYIFIGLLLTVILLIAIRSIVCYKLTLRASQRLHRNMFNAILGAPMKLFDTNPLGRFINRFSRDMGLVDDILPRTLLDTFQICSVTLSIISLSLICNYYIIIPGIFCFALCSIVGTLYLRISWKLRHLGCVSKSPILSHITSTITGLTTIRSSKVQNRLQNDFDLKNDVHFTVLALNISTAAAFGLCLDTVITLFALSVCCLFVILHQVEQNVSANIVGLAVSQICVLINMVQLGIAQLSDIIGAMASVHRISEYTNLEKDGVQDQISIRKTTVWPILGRIEFRNLSLKYSSSSDELMILKNLNIMIKPGSKIGVVGRTGAGKSSLIAALFRLTPISKGAIFIDGIDTRSLQLDTLRCNISIISQVPVVFTATIRYNLDPTMTIDDEKLWSALKDVELETVIDSLDTIAIDGGSSFSVGEKQLLCLARAIVRKNRILILDEATANVDTKTDDFIQNTIRRKFQNCTVITIAHRLNTIMDSDKVLVLDNGRVMEYDNPHLLLQNVNGYFYKMLEQTGPLMTQQLKQIADEHYINSYSQSEYL